jgi:hypothetical protein
MGIVRTATVLLITGLLLAGSASADPKRDVIELRNGDRFTGEIRELNNGRLELKTDDVGTIYIEWDKVRSVFAPEQFEVLLLNGRILLGQFQTAQAGKTELETMAGPIVLALTEIASVRPIGASFWKRLDGGLSLGFSHTRSSGVTQFDTSFNASYRRPAFEATLATDATLSRTRGTDDTQRASLQLGYSRLLGNRWIVGGFSQIERNESLGIDLRGTLGGLVGRRLTQSPRSRFVVAGGLAGNRELPTGESARTNLDAVLLATYSFFKYDSPKTNINTSTVVSPSLSDPGRVRIAARATVQQDIWKDFGFAVTFFDTYDSRPPAVDALQNDYGVTTSVSWTF